MFASGAIRLFSRARKTAPATIGPSGSKPSATQGHTTPGASPHSKNTPGAPTLSGPERRPRRLLRTVYRCRLVAPTRQSPHHLSAPLIATARLHRPCGTCLRYLSVPSICIDSLPHLLRRSCADYLHRNCVALCTTCPRRLSLPPGCNDNAEPACNELFAQPICGAPSAAGRCPSSADSPPPAPRARFQPRARR